MAFVILVIFRSNNYKIWQFLTSWGFSLNMKNTAVIDSNAHFRHVLHHYEGVN